MKKADLQKYEQLLIAKRKELTDEIEDLRKDSANTIKDSTGDLSSYSYHMADLGTDTWEQELTLGLIENERNLLREIDEALERDAVVLVLQVRRVDPGPLGQRLPVGALRYGQVHQGSRESGRDGRPTHAPAPLATCGQLFGLWRHVHRPRRGTC